MASQFADFKCSC